jgi:hypothetical protein
MWIFQIIVPGERALNSKGYNIYKISTASIQYVERIFERRRGFRISGEKLLILKKGPGPRNAWSQVGGWESTLPGNGANIHFSQTFWGLVT